MTITGKTITLKVKQEDSTLDTIKRYMKNKGYTISETRKADFVDRRWFNESETVVVAKQQYYISGKLTVEFKNW